MSRAALMVCFDDEQTQAINQMWINVRFYNIHDVPVWVWMIAAVGLVLSDNRPPFKE